MVLVELHPHARERASERETTEEEIVETVRTGESYPVKFGRMGFRKTFKYARIWRGRRHANKEVEAIAVKISEGWLVLTVITRFS